MKKKILSLSIVLRGTLVQGYTSLTLAQDQDKIKNSFGSTTYVDQINVPKAEEPEANDDLIKTIRSAVNRVLGILSLITLLLSLYAGFKMLTSQGDSKKYSEGFGILKNAAIGLFVIGASWLIVSLIFWFITGAIDNA